MKRLLPVLFLLGILAGSVAAQPPSKGVPAVPAELGLFEQAIQATRAGGYAEAERLYRRAVGINPRFAAAWANLGLLQGRDRRYAEAVASLERAVRVEPKNVDFLEQLARFQAEAGRGEAAVRTARRALGLSPRREMTLSLLAGALVRQRRWVEALEPLRTLNARRGGKEAQVLGSLVTVLANLGRKAEARVLARQWVALAPRSAEAHLMRGDLAGQIGTITGRPEDMAEARRAYARAYELSGGNVRAGINAAVSAELAGNPKEAERILLQVIARHPEEAAARLALGRLYYGARQYVRAQKQLEVAVGRDPRNPDALIALGYALMFQGPEQDAAATNYFQAAQALRPRDQRPRRGLGFLAERAKRGDEAIALYRAILADFPGTYDVQRRIVGLLLNAGKKEEAYAELRALAARHPRDTKALRELASFLFNDRQYEAARAAGAQAVARDPKDADARTGLGQALERLGRLPEARAQYEAACAAQPRHEAARVGLINLLVRQGKSAEALQARAQWVAADPASSAARWDLAMACQEARRDEEALAQMRQMRLVKDDPRRLMYRLGPANLFRMRGRHADEVAELQRVLAEEPAGPDRENLRYGLADALERAGRVPEAEALLDELARSAKPDDARPALARAGLYERTGRLEEAALALEERIARKPDLSAACYSLRRIRQAQGKGEAATGFLEGLALAAADEPVGELMDQLETFYTQEKAPEKYLALVRRSIEKYPKSRSALQRGAQTLLRGVPTPERRAEAVELYRRIAALGPADADARYQLGRQLQELGKRDEAIVAYTESARLRPDGPAAVALKALGAPVPPPAESKKSDAPPAARGN